MTSRASEKLTLAWRDLAAGLSEDDGIGMPTLDAGVDTGYGRARLSLEADSRPSLLLPISASAKPLRHHFPGAISVQDNRYKTRSGLSRMLCISLVRSDLSSIFVHFVREVLSRLSKGEEPILVLADVVDDFRGLLEAGGPDGIGFDRLLGAFGELHVLCQMLEENAESWRAWQGPNGDRHDFRKGGLAVEVKSTLQAEPVELEISSLDQMTPPEHGNLYLLLLSFETNGKNSVSYADLVSKARRLASDSRAIDDLLSKALDGRSLSREEKSRRFTMRIGKGYRVVEGFPRLTPASFVGGCLPSHVISMKYKILVPTQSDFEAPSPHWRELIQEVSRA